LESIVPPLKRRLRSFGLPIGALEHANMRPPIFVSYSHRDAALVRPVVALLRASEAQVFRDADSLRPGKKWRDQLATAIRESEIVLVFWCHHAHGSEEVRKEYLAARGQDKDLLPVLIDDTPLPQELAEYQFIDFREAFAHTHQEGRHGLAPRSGRPWLAILSVVLLALALSVWYWLSSPVTGPVVAMGPVSPASAASSPPSPISSASSSASTNFTDSIATSPLVLVFVGLALVTAFVVLRRASAPVVTPEQQVESTPPAVQ